MSSDATVVRRVAWAAALLIASAPIGASLFTRASAAEAGESVRDAQPQRAAQPGRAAQPVRCLTDGTGYLRAQLRGSIDSDIDWRRAALECEGGMRPDGHGIRVSFAGAARFGGTTHRLRFIFGIAAAGEGRSGRAVPANVTLIVEGERRIFSTRGDDKCTIDDLRQEPIARTRERRDYRVAARGFCVGPAARLTAGGSATGGEHVLVDRFDFNGRISLYTDAAGTPPANTRPYDSRRLRL